jgi:hypothetical protein
MFVAFCVCHSSINVISIDWYNFVVFIVSSCCGVSLISVVFIDSYSCGVVLFVVSMFQCTISRFDFHFFFSFSVCDLTLCFIDWFYFVVLFPWFSFHTQLISLCLAGQRGLHCLTFLLSFSACSCGSRRALVSNQPPIQWTRRALSPGVKRPGREVYHSPPTSAEVKKMWIYTSTIPYAFMA